MRKPAREAARGPRLRRYKLHRARRHALLGVVAVLLLAYEAFSGAGHPPNDRGHLLNYPSRVLNNGGRVPSEDRTGPPAVSWPQSGQAAFVLGKARPSASPYQQPAPIASLAKLMTAYLTLEHYPISGEQEGFSITVTAADAEAAAEDATRNQSVVAVQAGEPLSERQLLEALLIPSGNNIASMLAAVVAGSETRFLAEMNAKAGAFGMSHTTYTDPSGFDPGTVSTAADQLRLLQRTMRFTVFRQIVSMASVTLPVAGTLTNFNPLLAEGYAGKTGSDSAAGGCLAFFTHVTVGGRRVTAAGVVLGQGRGSNTSTILAAAGDAAEQLVDSLVPASRVSTQTVPGAPGDHDEMPAGAAPLGAVRLRLRSRSRVRPFARARDA
jgi:D-alanyl-D-alanine carboxypeptidase (penicillin-binding protein 5/6)